jgi:SAM-dependent methyltransferase
MFSIIRRIHGLVVFDRRVRVLSESVAKLIPPGSSVLDIGCGSGRIAVETMRRSPTVTIRGVEPSPRPGCLIACDGYDGTTIPCGDAAFDCCMLIDVLHHTDDIPALLREARRVSRHHILIKDHLCENRLDRTLLALMDWAGNRPHGVKLSYNYIGRAAWARLFEELGLRIDAWTNDVPLYAFPLSLVFDRDLHFLALLEKR